MKNLQNVVEHYESNRKKRRRYIAALSAMSLLVSFAVPYSMIKPASSITVDDSMIATQLSFAGDNMISNMNDGKDGNNGKSPGQLSEKALLIGEPVDGAEETRDWLIPLGDNPDASQILTAAQNKYFLGIASDFCIFLENDFKPNDSDTEGRVAVGGSVIMTKNDNYQIGAGDFGSSIPLKDTDNYQNIQNFAHLIMGNSTTLSQIVRIAPYGTTNGGADLDTGDPYKRIVIPSSLDLTDSELNYHRNDMSETVAYVDKALQSNNHKHYVGDGIEEKAQFYQSDSLINFTDYFVWLRKQSSDLAGISGNSPQWLEEKKEISFHANVNNGVADYSNAENLSVDVLKFTGPGKDSSEKTVYFTIDEWLDPGDKCLEFVDIPEYIDENGNKCIANIVINVKGKDIKIIDSSQYHITFTYINGERISNEYTRDDSYNKKTNNNKWSENILYNFYEAEKLVIDGNFNGTILAPNADVTSDPECHGHLSGALIAKSFEGGLEFGYRPYRGTNKDILGSGAGYSLPFEKFIESVGGEYLPGATFTITDSDGKTVGSFTSEADKTFADFESKIKFDGSVTYDEGNKSVSTTYTITESSAPVGYIMDGEKYYTVMIDETVCLDCSDCDGLISVNDGTIPTHVHTQIKVFDGDVAEPFYTISIDLVDIYSCDANGSYEQVRRKLTYDNGQVVWMNIENGRVNRVEDGSNVANQDAITVYKKIGTKEVPYEEVSSFYRNMENGEDEDTVKASVKTEAENNGETVVSVTAEALPPEEFSVTKMAWSTQNSNNANIRKIYFYHSDGTVTLQENLEFSGTDGNYWYGCISFGIEKNVIGVKIITDDESWKNFENFVIQGSGENGKESNIFTNNGDVIKLANGETILGYVPGSNDFIEDEEDNGEENPEIEGDGEDPETEGDGEDPKTEGGEENSASETEISEESKTFSVPNTRWSITKTIEKLRTEVVREPVQYDQYVDFISGDLNNEQQIDKGDSKYYYNPDNMMVMPVPGSSMTFVNERGLVFSKVDKDDSNALLSGATINLYPCNNNGKIIEGKVISVLDGTGAVKTIDLKELSGSDYWYFKEEDFPDGYEEKEHPIYLHRKDNGWESSTDLQNWTQVDITKDVIQMENVKVTGAEIQLEKWDQNFDNQLKGAKFELYRENGENDILIYPTTSGENGANDIEIIDDNNPLSLYKLFKANPDLCDSDYIKNGYLSPGVYYLTETKSADGYDQYEGDFTFRINNDNSVEIVPNGTQAYIEGVADGGNGSTEMYIYANKDKTSTLQGVTKIEILLDGIESGEIQIWESKVNNVDNPIEGKKYSIVNGVATLEIDGGMEFGKAKVGYYNNQPGTLKIKGVKFYTDGSSSDGSSSGDSTDTNSSYTVDCLYFKEAWGTNVIEEMTVYYANGDTSTLNQRVPLNNDTANFVRITSGDGISLNHPSRDNIVGMEIKMSSTNGFKLAIENGDWSSTLWGYNGEEWMSGNRTLKIGQVPSGDISTVSLSETEEIVTKSLNFSPVVAVMAYDSNTDPLVVTSGFNNLSSILNGRAVSKIEIQFNSISDNDSKLEMNNIQVAVFNAGWITNKLDQWNWSDNMLLNGNTMTWDSKNGTFVTPTGFADISNTEISSITCSSSTINKITFYFDESGGTTTDPDPTPDPDPKPDPQPTGDVLNAEMGENNTIKIPNKAAGEKIKVSVEKEWKNDKNFTDLRNREIEVTLKRKNSAGEEDTTFTADPATRTLNENNKWKASWTDLDKTDANQNPWTYFVEENINPGSAYKASYNGNEVSNGNGSIKIINTLKTIKIDVEKNWVNTVSATDLPDSIAVNLLYSKDEGKTWETLDTLTLTASDDWKGKFENLYEDYQYKIEEVEISGWTASYSPANQTINKDSTNKTVEITNTRETGDLGIEKIWDDDNSTNKRPEKIMIDIYRSITAPETNPVSARLREAAVSTSQYEDYARLLQYSLYFYDANMCGDQVTEKSAVDWRNDCHVYDDSTVTGGFHDAGDHTMFGLPQGFTASSLGWSYYEFKEDYDKLGQTDHYQTIMKHFCDFFVASTKLNSNGEVESFLYQRGNPSTDQKVWNKPEGETKENFGEELWISNGASNIAAEYAAALAQYAINFPDDTTHDYLAVAKSLYKFSKEHAGEIYSCSQYQDSESKSDLAWAAAWLYLATKENTYKSDCSERLSGASITDDRGYFYADVTPAVMCLYKSHIDTNYDWSALKNYLDTWSAKADYVALNGWGSARHNALFQQVALSATKNIADADYKEWCKKQMGYMLGNNDGNVCLVTGFAENSVKYPHHRAASGITGYPLSNSDYTHTLVGALAGGPAGTSFANFPDDVKNYTENEVAIDYNSGLVGAAAGLYHFYETGNVTDGSELEAYGITPYSSKPLPKTPKYNNVIDVSKDENQMIEMGIKDKATLVVKDTEGNYYEDVEWTLTEGKGSDGKAKNIAEIITLDRDGTSSYLNGNIIAESEGIVTGKAILPGNARSNDAREIEFTIKVNLSAADPEIPGESPEISGTSTKVTTLTLQADEKDSSKNWKVTLTDLPLCDANGNRYYYYAVEKMTGSGNSVTGNGGAVYYPISYNGNGLPLATGKISTIKVTNKTENKYEGVTMPSAGGTGTEPYEIAGMLLTGGALTYLMTRKRKKEEL